MGALIQQSFVLAGSQPLVRGALVWRRPVFEILAASVVQPAEAMSMVLERTQVSQLRDDHSLDAVMLPPLFSFPASSVRGRLTRDFLATSAALAQSSGWGSWPGPSDGGVSWAGRGIRRGAQAAFRPTTRPPLWLVSLAGTAAASCPSRVAAASVGSPLSTFCLHTTN